MMKRNIISISIAVILVFALTMTCSFAANGDAASGGEDPGPQQEQQQDQTDQSGSQSGDGSGGNGQNTPAGNDSSNGSDNSDSVQVSDSSSDSGSDVNVKNNERNQKSSKKKNTGGKDQVKTAAKNANLSEKDEEKAIGLEDQIQQMEREMAAIDARLKEMQDKIDAFKKKEDAQSKKLKKKQKEVAGRLRMIYKSGSTGFLDVVLNSENIGDMLSNTDMLERIYKNDERAIAKLEKEYKELVKKGKELKKAQKEQKKMYAEQLKKMDEQNDTILASAYLFAAGPGSYKGGKLSWPCPSSHRISSGFGYRNCPFHGRELHRGIDIPTYTGADILAACDGVVIRSAYSSGYGNYVMISHGGGLATLYAHNSKLVAEVGRKVKRGDVIALAGSTGPSTGTHCHFEVQMNGKLMDPLKLLKK